MNRGAVSHSSLDLEALDDFLSSDASPDNCMQLSGLDGFLTAIVVGPGLIQPSEWFPVIWGGGSPEFESDETAERIIGTIMGRYNEIMQALASDPPQIEPIFWQENDGEVMANDWALGFLDALKLRPDDWSEMLEDEEAALPLVPIIALAGEMGSDDVAQDEPDENEERLIADLADLVPHCVIVIDAFWKGQRGPASNTSGTVH